MHHFQLLENSDNPLVNLQYMRKHNQLCDVVLIYEGIKYLAHSCILSSQSPALAGLMQARVATKNEWSIFQPLIIVLNDGEFITDPLAANTNENVESSVIELLLSFIYGEAICVEENLLDELFRISKILGLLQHFKSSNSAENYSSSHQKKPRKRKNLITDNVSSNPTTVPFTSTEPTSVPINSSLPLKSTTACASLKLPSSDQILLVPESKKVEFVKPPEPCAILKSIKPKSNNCYVSNDTEEWFENELMNSVETKSELDYCQVAPRGIKNVDEEPKGKGSKAKMYCEICSAAFHRVVDIINHIKRENHFSAVCPICYLQLNLYTEQRDHFLQHDHSLPFFCQWCDLRFRSRGALSMHSPKHSNERPYTCNECGRAFKWRQAAQAHAITHMKHSHLLCDICGFSSKYRTTFESHLKRHYDQYFPCPHPGCNFKSFRNTHLNNHMITHSKLRPHQCDVCGRAFSHSKNLRRHMRLHSPASALLKCSPHSDGTCSFATTRADKLRVHLLKKHNISDYKKSHPIPDVSSSSSRPTSLIKKSSSNTKESHIVAKVLNEQNCRKEAKRVAETSPNIPEKTINIVINSDSSNAAPEPSYDTYVVPDQTSEFETSRLVVVENGEGPPQCIPIGDYSLMQNHVQVPSSSVIYVKEEEEPDSQMVDSSELVALHEDNFQLVRYLPLPEDSSGGAISVILDDPKLSSSTFSTEQYQIELPVSAIDSFHNNLKGEKDFDNAFSIPENY